MAVIDITPSDNLQPTYYLDSLKYDNLPSVSKIRGFKNQYKGISTTEFVLRVATHAMATGGTSDAIPYDKTFALAKMGTGGSNKHGDVQSFENAGRNLAIQISHNRNFILTSELGEELGNAIGQANPGKPWHEIEPMVRERTVAFHKGFVQEMMGHHGIKVHEVLSFGEYGAFHVPHQGKPSTIGSNPSLLAAYRLSMSTKENAQKQYQPSYNSFHATDRDKYYETYMSWMNMLHRLYWQSMSDVKGAWVYDMLYQVFRIALGTGTGDDKRLQLFFGWDKIQDLQLSDEHGNIIPHLDGIAGTAIAFNNPKGVLSIAHGGGATMPFPHALAATNLSMILTEGEVCWSDVSDIEDVTPEGHEEGLYGGYEDGRNNPYFHRGYPEWTPDGGNIGSYTPGDPNQPKHYNAPGVTGGFNRLPLTTKQAKIAGANMYAEMEQYLSGRWRFPSIQVNSGSWYTPQAGSAGNSYIPSAGQPNYYTEFPLLDWVYQELGISLFNNGVCVYYNPRLQPHLTEIVKFKVDDIEYDLGEIPGCQYTVKVFR